jgi:hypothetical protein
VRTSAGDKNIRSNNLGWYLFAEYALSEMMPDNSKEYELTAGFLSQPFQALGVPPELIRKIELTLTGFAQKTRLPDQQGGLERLGGFRVFCQKKVIGCVKAAKSSRPDHAEPTMEPVPIQDPFGSILNGGWGYFIVERSRGFADSSERIHPLIDLYLYKEGE